MTQVVMTPPSYFGELHIPEAPDLEQQLSYQLTERFVQTLTQRENPYGVNQLLMVVSDVLEQLEQRRDLTADAEAWLYHQGMAYLLNLRDYLQQWPSAARNAVELFPNCEQLKCLAFVVGRSTSRAK